MAWLGNRTASLSRRDQANRQNPMKFKGMQQLYAAMRNLLLPNTGSEESKYFVTLEVPARGFDPGFYIDEDESTHGKVNTVELEENNFRLADQMFDVEPWVPSGNGMRVSEQYRQALDDLIPLLTDDEHMETTKAREWLMEAVETPEGMEEAQASRMEIYRFFMDKYLEARQARDKAMNEAKQDRTEEEYHEWLASSREAVEQRVHAAYVNLLVLGNRSEAEMNIAWLDYELNGTKIAKYKEMMRSCQKKSINFTGEVYPVRLMPRNWAFQCLRDARQEEKNDPGKQVVDLRRRIAELQQQLYRIDVQEGKEGDADHVRTALAEKLQEACALKLSNKEEPDEEESDEEEPDAAAGARLARAKQAAVEAAVAQSIEAQAAILAGKASQTAQKTCCGAIQAIVKLTGEVAALEAAIATGLHDQDYQPPARNGWTSMTFTEDFKATSDESSHGNEQLSVEAEASYGFWCSGGSLSQSEQHEERGSESQMKETSLKVSMKVKKVTIERDWLSTGVFNKKNTTRRGRWVSPGICKENGEPTNSSHSVWSFPSMPVAFVVVKDVELEFSGLSARQRADFACSASQTDSSVSGCWGCFSGSASVSHSQSSETSSARTQETKNGVKISLPGSRIMAWMLQLTPRMPREREFRDTGNQSQRRL